MSDNSGTRALGVLWGMGVEPLLVMGVISENRV